jgi:hypothetical protein
VEGSCRNTLLRTTENFVLGTEEVKVNSVSRWKFELGTSAADTNFNLQKKMMKMFVSKDDKVGDGKKLYNKRFVNYIAPQLLVG